MSDPNKLHLGNDAKPAYDAEITQAYMETLNQQLDKHGRPAAICSDKHSETCVR